MKKNCNQMKIAKALAVLILIWEVVVARWQVAVAVLVLWPVVEGATRGL